MADHALVSSDPEPAAVVSPAGGHGDADDGPAGAEMPRAGSATAPAGAWSDRLRVVVVGASDAVGYGADDPAADAWPEVLARTALPAGAVVVNLGIPGATVADALAEELPAALAGDASVALVWLCVNDLLAQVPAATFESQLGRLVAALRRGGATRVLVANTPPLDRLPICVSGLDTADGAGATLPVPGAIDEAVDAYNAAIARIVAAEDADLVDLHAATQAARASGADAALVAADGFHPSTAGHRALAAAFAQVLSRS